MARLFAIGQRNAVSMLLQMEGRNGEGWLEPTRRLDHPALLSAS